MTLWILALAVALALVVGFLPTRYFVPFGTQRTLLDEWTGRGLPATHAAIVAVP